MSHADPELHALRYAFGAAFRRMCEATSDDLMAELSSLLHHLFRLRELCKMRLTGFNDTEWLTADLTAARAAIWARNFDTHQLYTGASLEGVFSGFFTAMYGVLVWKPLSSFPEQQTSPDRGRDYAATLEGKTVLDTVRHSIDTMAGLLTPRQ